MARRRRRKQSLEDMGEVSDFAKRAAIRFGLDDTRMHQLFDILRDAFYSSATGRLGVRKAVGLTLEFVGAAMQIADDVITWP